MYYTTLVVLVQRFLSEDFIFIFQNYVESLSTTNVFNKKNTLGQIEVTEIQYFKVVL